MHDIYFCFLFWEINEIPIKIPTGSIQDKEIEYFTFSYLHGSCLFILWLHCGFCNKKGNIWDFSRFCHLQTSGKPLNTFSMAMFFVWPSLHLFTAMHTFLFLSFTKFFFRICDWGIFFYSRDPRFMSRIDSPWFVKFSKMANVNFHESWFEFVLNFLWFVTRNTAPPFFF